MGTLHIATVLLAVTGTGETVLLDFQATWCGPCRQMDPHIERLADAGYPVRKIDVDQQQDMARRFRVQNIPCFVLLVNGEERGRIEGKTSPEQLRQLFTTAGVGPVTSNGAVARGQSPDRRRFRRNATPRRPVAPEDLMVRPLQIELGTLVSAASTDRPQQFFGQPAAPRAAPQPPTQPSSLATRQPPAATRQPPAAIPNPVRSAGFEQPRNSSIDPSLIDQLMAVSVRLRVEDANGVSNGSGTVIDSIPGENGQRGQALILTCGHIFRDSQGKGPIRVDLFENGRPRSTQGFLVRYDLQRDIALVSIYTDQVIPTASFAPANVPPRQGDQVVGIGCPGGGSPTALHSRILSVDNFGGGSLIQASGEPAEGRSGGGLFNASGQVIGVSNFADPSARAGLYADLSVAKQVFEDAGLAQIYHNAAGKPATSTAPVSAIATTGPAVPAMPKMPSMPASAGQPSRPSPAVAPLVAVDGTASTTSAEQPELICIVRSSDDKPATVITIDQASQALLQQIETERLHPTRTTGAGNRIGPTNPVRR